MGALFLSSLMAAADILEVLLSLEHGSVLEADEADLIAICNEARDIFAEENPLLQLEPPANLPLWLFGDIHGQYWDMQQWVRDVAGGPGPGNFFMFDGDLVD